jgi:hypothetical protein
MACPEIAVFDCADGIVGEDLAEEDLAESGATFMGTLHEIS